MFDVSALRPLALLLPLVVTALAPAAGWAQDKAVPVAGLYTFGQPRVGNIDFARHFASLGVPYFRVINERDAVAGIPLKIGNIVSTAPTYGWPATYSTSYGS